MGMVVYINVHFAYILCLFAVVSAAVQISSVTTDCGVIQGIQNVSYVFKGIPYALPPTGRKRWQDPVPISSESGTSWSGSLQAFQFGSPCVQVSGTNQSEIIGSEDCLFLNVWTPSIMTTSKLPVMVFIHGGSLQSLSGNWPSYSPTEELAVDTNIVYVSINYRLQAFGFMALDILSQASPRKTSGNYGFMDQIAALQWVNKNIINFGGDPTQVTLFGQSSGGTSVFALLSSPLVSGLISKAWLSSASPILNKTLVDASRDNLVFLRKSGCSDLKCLLDLSASEVSKAVPWNEYPYWSMIDQGDLPLKGYFDGAIAIVDGIVIPHPPFETWAMGQGVRVPLIIGTTAQEIDFNPIPDGVDSWTWAKYVDHVTTRLGTFGQNVVNRALQMYPINIETPEYQFTSMASDIRVTCPNDKMALMASAYLASPVYRYVVTARPSSPFYVFGNPIPSHYSFHTLDMYAYFDTLKDFTNLTLAERTFQENFRREIVSFVKTGKPHTTEWKVFGINTAIFDNYVSVTKSYHRQQCQFWNYDAGMWSYAWIN